MATDRLPDIVTYSKGVCSTYIACRLKDEGHEPICVFSDTKREDADTYRFGCEIEQRWRLNVVDASDGRDLWDVFRGWNMIPARQLAACSIAMKVKPFQKWLESFEGPARVAYGYDLDEEDRAERTRQRWNYPNLLVWFPMIEWGVSKRQAMGYFMRHGIALPRVYQYAPNANCWPCKNWRRQEWIACYHRMPEVFANSKAFEMETGLRWMQDGPTLTELEAEIIAGLATQKRKRALPIVAPAFDFSTGCDRCAAD